VKLNVYVCDICDQRFEPSKYEEQNLKLNLAIHGLVQTYYAERSWDHVCIPCKLELAHVIEVKVTELKNRQFEAARRKANDT